jgi:2-methylaconitate cis-trans-isomerase PrpF
MGDQSAASRSFRISHPSGVLDVLVDVATTDRVEVRTAAVLRTARRIMEGTVTIARTEPGRV